VRSHILAATLFITACASANAEAPRDSIQVFYSETMNYTIEDGGAARLVGGADHPAYEFQASREDFRQIADLLEPLQAAGLPCSEPSEHIAPGRIVWRRDGEEAVRVEMHAICYADGARPLARNTDRAWRLMEEMGHARYAAPAIPAPTSITLENKYWGRTTSSWIVNRNGEGSFTQGETTTSFVVTPEQFDQIRQIFRPYEGRDFHCNRVIADGPYGFVVWSSQAGQEDQRTLWDAGCVTGDAGDLFGRLDQATEILVALREAAAAQR
jgi:hypothetical protein